MSNGASDDLPEVSVVKGRGVSIVWLIPIIAALVGGYMGWDAWVNRGVSVVITYPTADWVEAGKTKIKFRSVEIGTVDEVLLADGGSQVELHSTLHRRARPHLTEDAVFWIEHPRIGGGEISGLGTLLSGAYIGMRAGDPDKPPRRRFEGLEEPPIAPPGDGGLRVRLRSKELYSIREGTLVFYLQQPVGKVERYDLAESGDGFEIHVYVRDKYKHLVRADSRFWNAGGIQVSGGIGRFDVKTPSLVSMLSGGIGFDAPRGNRSPPAETASIFPLHAGRSDLEDYPYSHDGLRILVEAERLQGVSEGDPVTYREMRVGAVIGTRLATDSRRIRVELNIRDRYASLVRHNTVFWNASGISADLGLTGVHVHAESLQSLLSGGVAFATPDPPGQRVKAGSVFRLHDEADDDWLDWKPVLWRGAPGEDPSAPKKVRKARASSAQAAAEEAAAHASDESDEKEGFLSRFFHHEGKSEDDAAADHDD